MMRYMEPALRDQGIRGDAPGPRPRTMRRSRRHHPMTPIQRILIVGGGTAGWLTAAFLAKTLGTAGGGPRITLVESADIGIVGVGEGTFPSIRGTLAAIGIDEARFIRECDA